MSWKFWQKAAVSEEELARERLITAAPELLKTLEECEMFLEGEVEALERIYADPELGGEKDPELQYWVDLLTNVRAAIALASAA